MSRGHASVTTRISAFSGVTVVAFLVLIGQLWYLQILEGPRLRELSEQNRIRVKSLPAPRGTIYDRHRVPLVGVRPVFTVSVVPAEIGDRDAVLGRLSALLGVPKRELEDRLRAAGGDSPWPVPLRDDLTIGDAVKVEEWRLELPGVTVDAEPRRDYVAARFAAHLLGYVREASPNQVRQGWAAAGRRAGQTGLERLLDPFLRGREGTERVEVDSQERPLRLVGRQEARAGANVVTTLDRRIQHAAERALGEAAGVIVVMDPRNGDLLAMASRPAYDVARLSGSIDREEWLRMVRDPQHPFLNRAFQAQYAPGSIFKLVVAAAALQEGLITPTDRLPCPATLRVGNHTFKNWSSVDQRPLTLEEAVAVSCNTFFYRLGLTVGIERIARYAAAFGFGEPTGIGLGDEKRGLVPRPHGRQGGQASRAWLPGDTANVAIGQGRVLATPLQVARFMAAVANRGVLWRPRLVHEVDTGAGPALTIAPKATGRADIAPAVFTVLRRALARAVREGTGAAAALHGVAVAGKTGTAQTIHDSDATKGQDHAWFAGFAPADDPRAVVIVLVERGGMGGKVAAPLARQVFEAIFGHAAALDDGGA